MHRVGWRAEPYPVKAGKLAAVIDDGETSFLLDVGGGHEIGDAALFASFMALRTGRKVGFDFSGVGTYVADFANAPDRDQLNLPVNFTDVVERRFANVTGCGVETLTADERFSIGAMVASIERAYEADKAAA